MSLEVTKLEIEYLKDALEEQKKQISELRLAVAQMDRTLNEIKLGRKWFWGFLSAAAIVGGILSTFMNILKWP